MAADWYRYQLRKSCLAVKEAAVVAALSVWNYRKLISILSGPCLGFLVYLQGQDSNDTVKVFKMAGILIWMATWWLTEAVPAPITALLPLPLFPLTGILYADDVAKAYWNDIVVLYFGSLVVALCIERWKVHRRLALKLLLSLGARVTDPRLLLLGFIGCTGVLSMFMSNTATSIMMVPMAVAVLHKVRIRNVEGIAMHTLTMTGQPSEPIRALGEVDPEEGQLQDAVIPLHAEDVLQLNGHGQTEDGSGLIKHAFVALPNRGDESPLRDRAAGQHSDDESFDEDMHDDHDELADSGEENLERQTESRSDRHVKSRLADMDDPVTQYCRAIVLGIAYAASIGGMGSLTATGPNLILAGAFRHMFPKAPQISYLDWLAFGFPLSFVLLIILWVTLCVIYCPPITIPVIRAALDRTVLEEEYNRLGPVKFAEKAVLVDFVALSLLWMTRSPPGGALGWGSLFSSEKAVGDGTASAFCAIILFVIPSFSGKPWQMLMDWETCRTMPWDIVLLLGGGFALSAGVTASGLAAWIGDHVSPLHTVPAFLIPPVIAIAVTFGTEFTSNSASATVILPLLAGVSLSMDRHPLLLMLPATLACSLAFMLPIATAQNAVAYSTGFLKLRHLLLPGIFLNLVGVVLISITVPSLGALIFGVMDDPSHYQWYSDAKEGLVSANSTTTP